MMTIPLRQAALGLFVVMVPPISLAQDAGPSEWDAKGCLGSKAPDVTIYYCDRVLRKPGLLPADALIKMLMTRGRAHKEAGDGARALLDFGSAMKIDASSGEAYFERGLTYVNVLDDAERGIADLTQAMRFGVVMNPMHRGLARFYKGDFDLAIEDAVKSLEKYPEQASTTHKSLGDIRRGKADFAGAIANYSEAIRLATSDTARSDYLAARATAYFSAGLLDEAAADSLEALRLVPRNAAAAIRLELIDRRKGRQGRLSKVAPQLNAASPIAKIVDLFLNRATPADVFSEFEKASPNDVRFKWFKRSRECTANYYVAQHALSQGKKTEAARLFRLVAVASRCPWYFGDARAELAALGI